MINHLDRRQILMAGVASAAMAASLSVIPGLGTKPSAAAGPFTRHRIGSAAGNAQLLAYRSAVGAMRERSQIQQTDPLGWTFQGMIHGILTRQAKQMAINVFFEGRPPDDSGRQLAMATWDTCPHTASIQNIRLDFLAWHRIYLYYLEKVARAASGDTNFTLPFWEYSHPDHRTIPIEFREAVGGALWRNPLYDPRRDPRLNDPADAAPLDLTDDWKTALANSKFEPTITGGQLIDLGFSLGLENDPHGPIHTRTSGSDELGNPNGDMGDTATAARDPIFWVHHAAIDWFWARWLNANHANDDWMEQQPWANETWRFVNEHGELVQWKFADFKKQVTDNPGYDSLDDTGAAASIMVAGQPQQAERAELAQATPPTKAATVASSPGLALSGRPTSVELEGQAAPLAAPEAVSAEQGLALRLSGVTTDRPVGVVYDVYVNLEDAARPDATHRVGTMSFFGMGAHAGHESANIKESAGRTFVFPLPEALRESVLRQLKVTFVPSASFAGEPVRVKKIELLRTSR